MKNKIYWPDNPFLVFFCASLEVFLFLRSGVAPGLAGALVLFFFARFFRIRVDEHFITGMDLAFLKREVIIPRGGARVVKARRPWGEAHVIQDRTSVQEISAYHWMFSKPSLAAIKQTLDGGLL